MTPNEIATSGDVDGLKKYIDIRFECMDSKLEKLLRMLDDGMQNVERALPDGFVGLQEAAEIANVSRNTITNWVRSGRLKRYSQGRKPLYSKTELLNQKR